MHYREFMDKSCPRTKAESCSCESIKTLSEQATDVKAYVELQQRKQTVAMSKCLLLSSTNSPLKELDYDTLGKLLKFPRKYYPKVVT